MSQAKTETIAGIIVLGVLAALAYPAVRLTQRDFLGGGGYRLMAQFDTVGGLERGAAVEIAGVPVGQVESVRLDHKDYADVTMRIANGAVLHDDAVAAVKSTGLMGGEYVSIAPGTSTNIVERGGRLRNTQDAINLEDLMAQLIQGKV